MVLYLDELIRPASDILDREDIPIIVWGEVTMKLHKIPTGILVSVYQFLSLHPLNYFTI